ncbi:MAG: terminase small subunit [Proteobacteria bacterium]|nr:terminase small subunit [Pseudomonadota bacterium]
MNQPLTEKQKAFVVNYVSNGANRREAVIAAGYSMKGIDVEAHRLLSLPHIQQAIRKEAEDHLNAHVGIAAKVLVDLAQNSKSDSVRLQAVQALLDRGGLPFVRQTEHKHTLEDNRTDAELKAHIEQLTDELGLNAKVIEHEPSKEPETKTDAQEGK